MSRTVVGMAVVLLGTCMSWGSTVYECDFEGYTLGALTGQGSPAWGQNFLNSYDTGGEVVSGVSYDGAQSLHLHGSYASCQQTNRVTLPSVTRAEWFEFAFMPNFSGENNDYTTWMKTTRGGYTDTVGIDMALTNNSTCDITIGGTTIGHFTNGQWQTISFKHQVSGGYYNGTFDVYLNGVYVTTLTSGSQFAYNGMQTIVFSSAESSWTKNGDWYVDSVHVGDNSIFSVEPPILSPATSLVSGSMNVTITCPTDGASIYYTTDGSVPSVGHNLYSGPVTVHGGTTLRAVAVRNGVSSNEISQTYSTIATVENRFGSISTISNDSLDCLLHNGSVHINGQRYTHILLSGTITNWTGYTDSNWNGSWSFVGLIGSDYFTNRNVPAVVDESMNVFVYVGDANYGDAGKQRGYAQNAGLSFWKNGYWSSLGQINNAFAAQDCDFAVGGSTNKVDLPWNPLENSTQFDYEVEYDLSAMTMTVRVKDVGDPDWDGVATIAIGLRDVIGEDDWSDLVTTMQMFNNLNNRIVYGYDYTLKTGIVGVLPGDANLDGLVDVSDLGILAANYGKAGGATWVMGDFNGDGNVDVSDLGILAANYGTGPSGADFDADYAKVFGSTADEKAGSSLCSSLGLPLIAGLAMLGLITVKLDE